MRDWVCNPVPTFMSIMKFLHKTISHDGNERLGRGCKPLPAAKAGFKPAPTRYDKLFLKISTGIFNYIYTNYAYKLKFSIIKQ